MARRPTKVVIQPFWLKKGQAAAACGITPKAFDEWHVPTVHEAGTSKYFMVADIIENRVDHALRRAKRSGGITSDEAKAAMDAAKLDEVNERTENMAIKNAILRRENAPISALEFALGKVCAQISATLESIPVRLKRRCPKLGAADIDIVKEEIVKCQNIASEATIDMDEFEG